MTDVEPRAHHPAPERLVGGSAACACMGRLVRQARTAVELETYIYEAGADTLDPVRWRHGRR